jgi:hypothetical protein
VNAQHTPYRARASRDKSEIVEAEILGEYMNEIKISGPVGKAYSFPFELCILHGLREHICMHKVRAQVLDNDVAVSHHFRNPEKTNVNVTGPFGPGLPRFMSAMQLRLS